MYFTCICNSPHQINICNALTLVERRIIRIIIYIKLSCISIYKCLVTTMTPENTMKCQALTLYIEALCDSDKSRELQVYRQPRYHKWRCHQPRGFSNVVSNLVPEQMKVQFFSCFIQWLHFWKIQGMLNLGTGRKYLMCLDGVRKS